jgi:CubicO group peptidase (beta-lactamase class C family)
MRPLRQGLLLLLGLLCAVAHGQSPHSSGKGEHPSSETNTCPRRPLPVDHRFLFPPAQTDDRQSSVPAVLRRALRHVEGAVLAATLAARTARNSGVTCVSAGLSYAGVPVWELNRGSINGSVSDDDFLSDVLSAADDGAQLSGGPAVPPTRHTLFRIGSVTKLLPALMAFKLAHRSAEAAGSPTGQRKISLDDTVQHIAPDFRMQEPFARSRGSQPTLRQLASQLGGLPRESPCDVLPAQPHPLSFGRVSVLAAEKPTTTNTSGNSGHNVSLPPSPPHSTFSCDLPTRTIFERMAKQPFILPADERPSYSNFGFSLLGNVLAERVVEPATTFRDWVHRHVLEPLRMHGSGFHPSEAQKKRFAFATGFVAPNKRAPDLRLGWDAPSGEMFSSVDDMLNFMRVFAESFEPAFPNTPRVAIRGKMDRRAERVLHVVSAREMLQPVYLNRDGRSMFASPWETEFVKSFVVRTKGGNVLGFSALVAVVPELRLSFVALWNGQVREGTIVRPVFDALIPAFEEALRSPSVQPRFPVATADPLRFVGQYRSAVGGEIHIRFEKNTSALFVRASEYDVPLTFTRAENNNKNNNNNNNNFGEATTVMQLWIPPHKFSCLVEELVGLDGEYAFFAHDSGSSAAVRLTLPGLEPGQTFVRFGD